MHIDGPRRTMRKEMSFISSVRSLRRLRVIASVVERLFAGFSRGAYQVRALAGMMEKVGSFSIP